MAGTEPETGSGRYERENPGELIHIDIKKLGRIGSVGDRFSGRQTGVNRSPRSPREQPVSAPQLAKTALKAAPSVVG